MRKPKQEQPRPWATALLGLAGVWRLGRDGHFGERHFIVRMNGIAGGINNPCSNEDLQVRMGRRVHRICAAFLYGSDQRNCLPVPNIYRGHKLSDSVMGQGQLHRWKRPVIVAVSRLRDELARFIVTNNFREGRGGDQLDGIAIGGDSGNNVQGRFQLPLCWWCCRGQRCLMPNGDRSPCP